MIKKSELLFNKCLSDEQKNDFNNSVGISQEDMIYRENAMLRLKIEEYKELLNENGIEIN